MPTLVEYALSDAITPVGADNTTLWPVVLKPRKNSLPTVSNESKASSETIENLIVRIV